MSIKPSKVTRVTVTIRPDQLAMVNSHAKHAGHVTLSEAVRAILDEWKRDRERELRASAGG